MVVRGNLHLPRMQLLHRMVPAMVSKLELIGLGAQRQSNELMSQTYPEYRLAAQQPPNIFLRVAAGLGISRAIG